MQTIVVTGTSRGIGKAIAEYLCQQNYVVGIARSENDPDTGICHQNYVHISADLTLVHDIGPIINTIRNVDVLINCAGIAAMNHSLTTPIDTVSSIYLTNVIASYAMSRECARKMINKGWGRIINFSSIAAAYNLPGESAYASSKAAIESVTRILAHEYGAYGITVNCIAPNPIKTDLIKGVPPSKINEIVDRQPIKRMGNMSDIFNLVSFFMDMASGAVTGQTIYVCGV